MWPSKVRLHSRIQLTERLEAGSVGCEVVSRPYLVHIHHVQSHVALQTSRLLQKTTELFISDGLVGRDVLGILSGEDDHLFQRDGPGGGRFLLEDSWSRERRMPILP